LEPLAHCIPSLAHRCVCFKIHVCCRLEYPIPIYSKTVAARYSARRGVEKPSPCATLRAAASRSRCRSLLREPRRQGVGLPKTTRYAVWDFGLCHLGQFERSGFMRADSKYLFLNTCHIDESTNHDPLVLPRACLLQRLGQLSTRCLPPARHLLQDDSLGPSGHGAISGSGLTLAAPCLLEDLALQDACLQGLRPRGPLSLWLCLFLTSHGP
jgi:hypothetical protein